MAVKALIKKQKERALDKIISGERFVPRRQMAERKNEDEVTKFKGNTMRQKTIQTHMKCICFEQIVQGLSYRLKKET